MSRDLKPNKDFVPSAVSANKPKVMTVIFFLCGPMAWQPARSSLAARVHSDPFVAVKSTGFMNSPLFVLQDIGQREKVYEYDVSKHTDSAARGSSYRL